MNLMRTLVRRPVLTTMFTVVLVVMGLYSYLRLTTELFPNVEVPVVTVTTIYPGASPSEVESQVTKRIEDEIASLADVEDLTSTSMDGVSSVVVEFALETSQDQDAIDVKDKIDAISGDLPEDVEDPIIQKFDLSASPVLEIALYGDLPLAEIYRYADEELSDQLSRIQGVSSVDIVGSREREIRVIVQPERLRPYGLGVLDVLGIVAANNLNVPVGQITRGQYETSVRMLGEIGDPSELADLRVPLPGGGEIPLSEIADISDTTEELREASEYQNHPSITLAVRKRSDGNTVDVYDAALVELDQIRDELPSGMKLEIVNESAQFVSSSVNDVLVNIGLGIVLTGILLWLFLHNLRLTLIAAIAMPVSVIATFLPIQASGFSVNVMTMMALGICIGTLVTNAIVVLQNIDRLSKLGKDPEDAAVEGTSQVAIAVVASTLTNVVVFTPIAFMSGIVGRFFMQFGMTVVFATVFSLVVTFTLVPMLAARMVGRTTETKNRVVGAVFGAWDRLYAGLEAGYSGALAGALRHRFLTLALTVLVFAGAMVLMGQLGGEFTPESDKAEFTVSVELPAGSSLDRSLAVGRRIAAVMQEQPEVTGTLVKAGGESRGVEDVDVLVTLMDKTEREAGHQDIMNRVRPRLADIADAKIMVAVTDMGGQTESDVLINLLSDDQAALDAANEQLLAIMRSVPGLVEIKSSLDAGKPELRVVPERVRLASTGLTAYDLGRTLRVAYAGDEAGVYRDHGEEYDVVVRLPEDVRNDPSQLVDLPMATPAGYTVSVDEVARIDETVGDATILHRGKVRTAEVGANITQGSLTSARQAIDAALAEDGLPGGVDMMWAGSAEHQDEGFASIFEALILAVILLYIVLAGILESFVHPITVMITLPLGLVGMALTLFLAGQGLNIMSLMAFVMLLGIVVNNAILLLDRTQQLRAEGKDIRAALLEACPERMQPILMANLAIAVGMLPQILLGSAGSEYRLPMAWVQLGGVLVSMVLTLFVVPVVYTLLDGLTFAGRRARKLAPTAAGIALVVVLALAAGSSDARELSLDQAIDLGLSNSELLEQAREQVAKAEGGLEEATAGKLPQLTVTGQYDRNLKKPVMFIPPDMQSAGLPAMIEMGSNNDILGAASLTLNLWTAGRLSAAQGTAQELLTGSDYQLHNVADGIRYQVIAAYNQVLLARAQLTIEEAARDMAAEAARVAAVGYAEGTVSKFDKLRADVEVANRLPQVLAAQNNLGTALLNLRRLCGLPADESLALTDQLHRTDAPIDIDSLLLTMRSGSPELNALRAQVRAAEQAVRLQKATRGPTLQAGINYAYQGEWDDGMWPDSDQDATSSAATLAFSWPVFDGYEARGRISQAKADQRTAALELERIERDKVLAVRRARLTLINALAILDGAEEAVTLAEEAYRLAEVRLLNGIATPLERLDAELALSTARGQLANSLYACQIAEAALELAVGGTVDEARVDGPRGSEG